MKPSEKAPAIDDMIESVFGVDRKNSIANNKCVLCGEPAVNFRDRLSLKEFTISGMCQNCQDQIFG